MTNPGGACVLHLTKITQIAGSENHLLALLTGLRRFGVDARALLLVEPDRPMDDYLAQAAARGIPAERVVIHRDLDPALYPRLWRSIRAARPDVVHTHLLHADLYGIPAARLAGVPAVITTRHNDDAFRRRFPIRQVNAALWRLVNAGIAISDAIAHFVREVERAPAHKVHTVRYGLEALPTMDRAAAQAALRRELGLPDEALLLGMVSRLVEQKGIPYALRAFERVGGEFPAAQLVIAGDGLLRVELELMARSLRVADRVHFLGWRADPAAILAALDVFLMPSLWEGFGLVLLEAMAQGLPVVGSAVSAIPEVVVDGETGLLCPPRDVHALAAALRLLLADPERRERMGTAGRARVEAHFSAARMVEETIALYQAVLGRPIAGG